VKLSRTPDSYYLQLDSLRALAVSMVIYSHWAGYHNNMWLDDSSWFNGQTGVQLFFVISGFLITGILLDEKHRAENQSLPLQDLIRHFTSEDSYAFSRRFMQH
jgi:peptidoglycan/LPS O-acetylase OafA/YrhL